MHPLHAFPYAFMLALFNHVNIGKAQFVKAGVCPLPAEKMLSNAISRCNYDTDCDGARKCCPTIVGRVCMLPDRDRLICPGGSIADRTCSTDADCPSNYECYKPKLICCPKIPPSKPGMCPPLVVPEGWDQTGVNHCSNDSECPGTRKCCGTLLGTRCLLPV